MTVDRAASTGNLPQQTFSYFLLIVSGKNTVKIAASLFPLVPCCRFQAVSSELPPFTLHSSLNSRLYHTDLHVESPLCCLRLRDGDGRCSLRTRVCFSQLNPLSGQPDGKNWPFQTFVPLTEKTTRAN